MFIPDDFCEREKKETENTSIKIHEYLSRSNYAAGNLLKRIVRMTLIDIFAQFNDPRDVKKQITKSSTTVEKAV